MKKKSVLPGGFDRSSRGPDPSSTIIDNSTLVKSSAGSSARRMTMVLAVTSNVKVGNAVRDKLKNMHMLSRVSSCSAA